MMQITELVLENFSSYEGMNKFDFRVRSKKPIILIGGQNGAGKTSVFTAVKIALYGPLAFGYTGNNAFYSKKIRSFINDKAFQAQKFSSSISIKIKVIKERKTQNYTIERKWHIVDSKIEEEYNIYEGSTRLTDNEKAMCESYILNIIPVALFDFFLFDGEEVGNIFSSDGYNKYVKSALITMCGLDDLEILQHFCRNYTGRNDSEAEAELNSKYLSLCEKLSEIQDDIKNCNDFIKCHEEAIDEAGTVIEQRNAEFLRSGGIPQKDVKAFEDEIVRLDRQREDIAHEVKDFFEGLMPFFIMRNMIPLLNQQAKYEEKASIYEYINNMLPKKFIRDILADSDVSENVADKLHEAVIKRFEISNGLYDKTIFDFSKSDEGKVLSLAEAVTDFNAAELVDKIEKKEQLSDQSSSIKQKLKNALSEEDAKHYNDEIAEAKHRIEILKLETDQKKTELARLISYRDELTREIEALKGKILDGVRDKHIFSLSDSISIIMERLIDSEMKNIRSKLSKKIIENLNKIYRKDNLISAISISEDFKFQLYQTQKLSIDDLRALIANIGISEFYKLIGEESINRLCNFFSVDRSGDLETEINFCSRNAELELYKRIDMNMLSKGERQIFILSLYWAIIQISGKKIPFIIDTPYARIDSNHREEISEKFFPNISSQVIILSTDEEITREYYNIIKPYISKEYLLSNNKDENKTTVTDGYFFKDGCT